MNTEKDLIAESAAEARNMKEYPLTPSQMGVYLACINDPDSLIYNSPLCYNFDKGTVDIERLKSAVETAVKNHEALRYYIDTSSGEPVMKS